MAQAGVAAETGDGRGLVEGPGGLDGGGQQGGSAPIYLAGLAGHQKMFTVQVRRTADQGKIRIRDCPDYGEHRRCISS